MLGVFVELLLKLLCYFGLTPAVNCYMFGCESVSPLSTSLGALALEVVKLLCGGWCLDLVLFTMPSPRISGRLEQRVGSKISV